MKKILLLSLTLAFSLISCSSPDSSDNNSTTSINPPSWMQGTWSIDYGYDDEPDLTPLFKFKNNDFCVLSGIEICYAEYLKQISKTGIKAEIEQSVTENEYKLSITTQSVKATYNFYRVSSNKIKYNNPDAGSVFVDLVKY
ncbi:hypothetical protein HNP99_001043 [Flavobacterium sp. 28A]|uniref:hypothetical protein n=1 Tax=Flavobacterium sp. 28A TaxID=2735895 RepID=UPI001571196C|nr:hypothetical protein [Flavobacterium sp. 28A]NRT14699.1 hypothetical protein [Flavobacterium sp. 28A]